MSPPAKVVRELLVQTGLCPAGLTEPWAAFTSFMPEQPDSSVTVYDTAALREGRLMRTGEVVEKPGVQIRLRAVDYRAAWKKAKEITDILDRLPVGTVVNIPADLPKYPAEKWVILNFSRQTGVLNAGMETEGDRRRNNLTVNATITMRKEN